MTNIEIQKNYQNESRFIGVYSRDNFPKSIKDGAYAINLDEYADIGTYWIALYVSNNNVFLFYEIRFDSFWVEHGPKEIRRFIGNKNIKQTYTEYKEIIQ